MLQPPAWASRGSLAWGERDPTTNTIPVYRPDGLWFTFDMTTGKTFNPPPPVSVESEEISDADWIARLHELADAADTNSVCYFIGAAEGPIKIGYSVNVAERLKGFQLGCPVPLTILATAPGGMAREAAYHAQFHETRAHGEWFERTPELLAEIERLTSPTPRSSALSEAG